MRENPRLNTAAPPPTRPSDYHRGPQDLAYVIGPPQLRIQPIDIDVRDAILGRAMRLLCAMWMSGGGRRFG